MSHVWLDLLDVFGDGSFADDPELDGTEGLEGPEAGDCDPPLEISPRALDLSVERESGGLDTTGVNLGEVHGADCADFVGAPWRGGEGLTILAGDPLADREAWELQQGDNACGVSAQRSVIELLTGQCLPESYLADFAEAQGWYRPESGTPLAHIGDLLEACGIPVEQRRGATLTDLYDALQRGDRVVVALDCSEIWEPSKSFWGGPSEQPNQGHAVVVTGIGQNADGSIEVVLNDPGHPDGAGFRVSLDDFENAWSDFGHFAAITQTGGRVHV